MASPTGPQATGPRATRPQETGSRAREPRGAGLTEHGTSPGDAESASAREQPTSGPGDSELADSGSGDSGLEDPTPPPIRVVTATSLFDGHDAAIHIVRRLLQAQGAEVVHLGHDRSVEEIVQAAIQEDAQAVAVSSYQGGHMEFFRYLVDRLRTCSAQHIRVYGGGGGTITPSEARELEAAGVAGIFGPAEGRQLGLEGMIREILQQCRSAQADTLRRASDQDFEPALGRLSPSEPGAIARLISRLERTAGRPNPACSRLREQLGTLRPRERAPVIGFTGTGGAGKSSVVDELVRSFRLEFPSRSIGLILVDPTRRRSGGALLGDRIRMNAIHGSGVYVRSLATRRTHLAVSSALADAISVLQAADFDLIVIETAGIGQSDSEIVDRVDQSIYVMTPEYGAPSQLEKIDMLDLADVIVLNKFDRRGAADALRDIRKQWRRNHADFSREDAEIPVFPTIARRFNDRGIRALYAELRTTWAGLPPLEHGVEHGVEHGEPERGEPKVGERPTAGRAPTSLDPDALIPTARQRYLAEIAELVRAYHADTRAQADAADIAQSLDIAREILERDGASTAESTTATSKTAATDVLESSHRASWEALPVDTQAWLRGWPELRERYRAASQTYQVRERHFEVQNYTSTLSGTSLPKVALPRTQKWADLVRYYREENLPGCFPFTAGVFPFRREDEDAARMFAGEGPPEQTNRRFHLLARGQRSVRLSTAFDSVTLYGRDPDERPDILGKVGNSGVSICTLDDCKKLYSGFDLCAPNTSVSMTINGPAPMLLAFFLNAAIDQGVERHLRETGGLERALAGLRGEKTPASSYPHYRGELPDGHDGLGLALLGVSGDQVVDPETYARIQSDVLRRVRGTVQADILKEDQAQNTCIFSTEFALSLMGDMQAYFVLHDVGNFYSVSISGYHIAEAGANPITQLAFTLANGLTYCEYYLARGMPIDAFANNFSFFFSNGLDAEYSVIGRVARRIWAIVMRERYGAAERSQKLKYHVQTSGRSLHAREMAFNDIRTTLQALTALEDRCDSLHTNAYDEAVTTPTEESVRRALAIQLIIARELGLTQNQNPIQGAYVIDELTDLVEESVLREFERLSERGGVLGAMETLYQRGRIQDESLHYESLKHSGKLPIIGVNVFESEAPEPEPETSDLARASQAQQLVQVAARRAFEERMAERAPAALRRLQETATSRGNVFAELMETVKVATLGQITDALFDVGGRYRRSL